MLDGDSNPVKVRCSPLVAGTPGTTGYVFVGADDGKVRVLNAGTGAYSTALTPMNGGSADGTKIRSAMAAYKGRLYIVTTGGRLYCFL